MPSMANVATGAFRMFEESVVPEALRWKLSKIHQPSRSQESPPSRDATPRKIEREARNLFFSCPSIIAAQSQFMRTIKTGRVGVHFSVISSNAGSHVEPMSKGIVKL